MIELRLAVARKITAAVVAAQAVTIWGRMVFITYFCLCCSSVEHNYNMSDSDTLLINSIWHRTI